MLLRLPNGSSTPACLAGFLLAVAICGCESTGWVNRLDEIFSPSSQPKTTPADEERHRVEYIESRSQESIQWLLRHRIDNGMSHESVALVLGETGTREAHDGWLKAGGGTNVQVGDDLYAYGPDDHSRMYYLVFRDNMLVDFDPKDYTVGKSSRKKKSSDDDDDWDTPLKKKGSHGK